MRLQAQGMECGETEWGNACATLVVEGEASGLAGIVPQAGLVLMPTLSSLGYPSLFIRGRIYINRPISARAIVEQYPHGNRGVLDEAIAVE